MAGILGFVPEAKNMCINEFLRILLLVISHVRFEIGYLVPDMAELMHQVGKHILLLTDLDAYRMQSIFRNVYIGIVRTLMQIGGGRGAMIKCAVVHYFYIHISRTTFGI